LEVCSVLVEYLGVDPNLAKPESGHTPLMDAAFGKLDRILRYLSKHGDIFTLL
jgi:ankyrin repeat protein